MQRNRIDIVFLVITSLLVGTVLGILIPAYFSEYGGQLMAVAIGVFVVVLVAVFAFALYGKQAVSKLTGITAEQMDDVAKPIGEAIKCWLAGERQRAGESVQTLARTILAKYVWITTRSFILVSSLSVVATIGGLSTTLLLLQQNALLKQQNTKIDLQNELSSTETQLLEQQTKLMDQQMILTEKSSFSDSTVAVRDLFNEIAIVAKDAKIPDKSATLIGAFVNRKPLQLSSDTAARIRFVDSNLRTPASASSKDYRSAEKGQLIVALHSLNVFWTHPIPIRNADLSATDIVGMEVVGATVAETDFSNSDLRYSVFSGCTIENCKFDHADLRSAAFCSEIPRHPYSQFSLTQNCTFSGAKFDGSYINSTFKNCDFTEATFSGAVIFNYSWESLAQQKGFIQSEWTTEPLKIAADLVVPAVMVMSANLSGAHGTAESAFEHREFWVGCSVIRARNSAMPSWEPVPSLPWTFGANDLPTGEAYGPDSQNAPPPPGEIAPAPAAPGPTATPK